MSTHSTSAAAPATPRISVIVPVYNVEPYIAKCLGSLTGQTMQELEFIIVDDCGTDRSMDIARTFAARDPRFRILEGTVNLGTGPCRNRGMDAARGEFIGFVDPDDWVAPDFFQLLYEKGVAEHADVVRGTRYDNRNFRLQEASWTSNDVIRKGLADSRWIGLTFYSNFWLAIYRTELLRQHHIQFPPIRPGQDVVFLLNVLLHTENIAFEDRAHYYYYHSRPDSADNDFSAEYFNAGFKQIRARGELINQSSLPEHVIVEYWGELLIWNNLLHYQLPRVAQYNKDYYVEFFTHVKEIFLSCGHAREICKTHPYPIFHELLEKTPEEIVRGRLKTLPKLETQPCPPAEPAQTAACPSPGIAACAWRYPVYHRRYLYCRLMSHLTWGRRKARYKQKKAAYKQLLCDIRLACRNVAAQRKLPW